MNYKYKPTWTNTPASSLASTGDLYLSKGAPIRQGDVFIITDYVGYNDPPSSIIGSTAEIFMDAKQGEIKVGDIFITLWASSDNMGVLYLGRNMYLKDNHLRFSGSTQNLPYHIKTSDQMSFDWTKPSNVAYDEIVIGMFTIGAKATNGGLFGHLQNAGDMKLGVNTMANNFATIHNEQNNLNLETKSWKGTQNEFSGGGEFDGTTLITPVLVGVFYYNNGEIVSCSVNGSVTLRDGTRSSQTYGTVSGYLQSTFSGNIDEFTVDNANSPPQDQTLEARYNYLMDEDIAILASGENIDGTVLLTSEFSWVNDDSVGIGIMSGFTGRVNLSTCAGTGLTLIEIGVDDSFKVTILNTSGENMVAQPWEIVFRSTSNGQDTVVGDSGANSETIVPYNNTVGNWLCLECDLTGSSTPQDTYEIWVKRTSASQVTWSNTGCTAEVHATLTDIYIINPSAGANLAVDEEVSVRWGNIVDTE